MNLKRQQACQTLLAGKLLAYPTEAVYGLGCLAGDKAALKKLRQLKKRSQNKGFIVLVSSLDQLQECFPQIKLSPQQLEKLLQKQPHPTTWVLPIGFELGDLKNELLGNNHSIALRICEHPTVQFLCNKVGPIVSTSANVSGAKPAKGILKLRKTFGKHIDYYLNEALGDAQGPSQIIDLQSGEILRRA